MHGSCSGLGFKSDVQWVVDEGSKVDTRSSDLGKGGGPGKRKMSLKTTLDDDTAKVGSASVIQ